MSMRTCVLVVLIASAGLSRAARMTTFADKIKRGPAIEAKQMEKALKEVQQTLAAARTATAQTQNVARTDDAGSFTRILAQRDLAAHAPGATVRWNEHNATVTFIAAPRLAAPGPQSFGGSPEVQATDAAHAFLQTYTTTLGMRDALHEFATERTSTDEQGNTHLHMQQMYNGIPVWGSDAVVHVDAAGNVYCFNGRYIPTPLTVATNNAAVSGTTAVTVAMNDLSARTAVTALSAADRALLGEDGPVVEQVIFPERQTQTPHLAWHVTARPNLIDRWEYFVDATTGAVIFKYYNTCTDGAATGTGTDLKGHAQTVHSYNVGGTYYMIDASRTMYDAGQSTPPEKLTGAILTVTANNTDLKEFYHVTSSSSSTWTDATAVSAHYNAGTTYEYYRNTHNRNSIDDKGMTMISVIHVTSGGQGFDNACWNGKFMIYGDGKTEFQKLASGLDVAGHEITHGVTQNSANLEYLSQSGALNESMSDFMGCMVERVNWQVGEDVVRPGFFASGALRDMQDPHNGTTQGQNGWQPATMSEYLTLPENENGDNGGVHQNSGIPNHAAYLVAQAITKEKAEKIYYKALRDHLTKNSQFIDARLALVQSAKELYGDNSPEMNAVKTAFDQVGITDGNGTGGPHDLPSNNGAEWILLTNYDTQSGDESLYRVKAVATPQSTDFQHLTTRQVYGRPSVQDDGSLALFIDQQGHLVMVTTNASTPQEQQVGTSTAWGGVSISRDGKRLAITSNVNDKSIYVLDLVNPNASVKTYTLYTPTYAQGVQTGDVVYASVMDWDPAGEYLIYDCNNVLPSSSGDTIMYWEINALRAWNKAGNQYGDGLIQHVFPSQPEGIDIGNPIFAKNAPYLLAFDLLDNYSRTSQVLSANLQTMDVGKVADNVYPLAGFPTFNRSDNIIAYMTWRNDATNGQRPGVNWVGLAANKISPSGAPQAWSDFSFTPVWYTIGSRPGAVGESATAPADFTLSVTPDPATDNTRFFVAMQHSARVAVTVYDQLGRLVATAWEGMVPAGEQQIPFSVAGLPTGTYVVTLQSGANAVSRTLRVVH